MEILYPRYSYPFMPRCLDYVVNLLFYVKHIYFYVVNFDCYFSLSAPNKVRGSDCLTHLILRRGVGYLVLRFTSFIYVH